MRLNLITPVILSLLAGCHGPDHSDNAVTEPPEVTNSVAQQALGTGAISVYPFTPSAITAPGIYKIVLVNGIETYSPVCPSTMTRLGAMKTDVQANQSAIVDFVEGTVISVATPFVALSSKYALQTVSGYETEKVLPPTPEALNALYPDGAVRDFDDMADWVLANAIPECIENTLSKLEYYIVVVAVARSGNIRSEKKGGAQFQPFDIGIGSVTIEELGRVQTVSTNRVFAISGRLYREGRETIHAMH